MCKVFINPEACGSYDLRYNGIDEIGIFGKFFVYLFSDERVSECLGIKY